MRRLVEEKSSTSFGVNFYLINSQLVVVERFDEKCSGNWAKTWKKNLLVVNVTLDGLCHSEDKAELL